MIWVAWRQHRMQIVGATGVLVAVAAFCLVSGPGMAAAFRDTGASSCLAGDACADVLDRFLVRYDGMRLVIPLFLALPALIGVFWGAPLLAREFEQGTHRLAWTQGVSRSRWLATKVGMLAVAAIAGTAALTLMLGVWGRPLVEASDHRLVLGSFDLLGVVPIAYALFALVLGVATGTVLRRAVPAMAMTLGAFLVVRFAVATAVRPHLAPARTSSYALFGVRPRLGLGDWILSSHTVDRAGRFVSDGVGLNFNALSSRCPDLPMPSTGFPDTSAIEACTRKVGLRVVELYQPGSRFWWFQGAEGALFLGLALVLFVFVLHRVRHLEG